MPDYDITYRGEFHICIEADSKEQAIEKAKGQRWEVLSDLHSDFIEIDENCPSCGSDSFDGFCSWCKYKIVS